MSAITSWRLSPQVWKQIQVVEKHFSGGVEMSMMKIEALCCIGRHQEAYALTTALMRSNAGQEGLLFWRAKCLYYMDQVGLLRCGANLGW